MRIDKFSKFNEKASWDDLNSKWSGRNWNWDKPDDKVMNKLKSDLPEIENILIDLIDISDNPGQVETILNLTNNKFLKEQKLFGFIFQIWFKNNIKDTTNNTAGFRIKERDCLFFDEISTITRRVKEMGYDLRLKISETHITIAIELDDNHRV